jgi:hypothetical protein
MNAFMQKYEPQVNGSLSGFDRLVFRGTLRSLAVVSGMMYYLGIMGVLLKDFGTFVERKTRELREASLREAERLQRPVIYVRSSKFSKESLAKEIAQRDGITNGLICVLSCVEECKSYEVFRDKKKKKLILEPRHRKCLYLYHYRIHPVFGFMHSRIQTWFPFSIQVCMNGREWLMRQMDSAGIGYERQENCFTWIEHPDVAQQLMDTQLRISWPSVLNAIAHSLNPDHEKMLSPFREEYYWSVYQSEWATDIMFTSAEALSTMYYPLVNAAITIFGSTDVMRFLGKKPNGNFKGEIVSTYRKRPEGVRIKHKYKQNSVKAYDKQGSVFRVETTINTPRDFMVYRPKEGGSKEDLQWRRMRQGVADIYRRAEISQASNERYLDSLASLSVDTSVGKIVESVTRPRKWQGTRMRALRPWSLEDGQLLETISRGEYSINGFRNRDIVAGLYPGHHDETEKRLLGARVSYRLRLLRAHGIIKKIPRTFRYGLTRKGRKIVTAILTMRQVQISRLMEMVA